MSLAVARAAACGAPRPLAPRRVAPRALPARHAKPARANAIVPGAQRSFLGRPCAPGVANGSAVSMVAAGLSGSFPLGDALRYRGDERDWSDEMPDIGAEREWADEPLAWEQWDFDPLGLRAAGQISASGDIGISTEGSLAMTEFAAARGGGVAAVSGVSGGSGDGGSLFGGELPKKLGSILLLLLFTRLGVYIPLAGVDIDAFQASITEGGLLQYVDTLSGGSIAKVGIFSLGIVPYINASIIAQLLTTVFPELKKVQREEGEAGRRKFQQWQRIGALFFAVSQAVGQCLYIKPYVPDYSNEWLAVSVASLTAGAMALMYVSEVIGTYKLGNGTSLLIFANIVSALPSSIKQTIDTAGGDDGTGAGSLVVFLAAFLATAAGIVYVQEAERKIPMNYSGRYQGKGVLKQSSYLPLKVNATGVMPVIFASSLLSLPAAAGRFTDSQVIQNVAVALYPGGPLYLPTNIVLICFFNYFYTFLQLDPKDVSEQLKKGGASIPGVRPGKNTADFISERLERMSILGSVFLGLLALTPVFVENLTGLTTFRGFAGTSLLIIVGVAVDTARRVKAEMLMQKYDDLDRLYDDM